MYAKRVCLGRYTRAGGPESNLDHTPSLDMTADHSVHIRLVVSA